MYFVGIDISKFKHDCATSKKKRSAFALLTGFIRFDGRGFCGKRSRASLAP